MRLLVFPAPPPVTGSPLPGAQEAEGRGPASWAGQSWAWEGLGRCRDRGPGPPLRPLLPLPSPPRGPAQSPCVWERQGLSYQRKLKVTLFLIDLAMFVNYSVTDVAKDN